jgi:hypothetical protein
MVQVYLPPNGLYIKKPQKRRKHLKPRKAGKN